MTFTATTLILVVSTVLCTSIAQLLQKQAAIQVNTGNIRSLSTNTAFLQSIFLLALSTFSWLMVLKRLDVSSAYPLLSINFILVPILAHWKFDEHLPFHRIGGSVIIIIGLAILSSG